MSENLIVDDVCNGKSNFYPTDTNIWKTYGVIRGADLAIVIEICGYLYFFPIHLSVSLASQPAHDS